MMKLSWMMLLLCGFVSQRVFGQVINCPTPAGTVTTQPTCKVSTGTIQLTNLPSGNWTLNRTGASAAAINGTGGSYSDAGLAVGSYRYTVSAGGCTSSASPWYAIDEPSCKPPLANLVTYTLPSQPASGQILTFDGSTGNPPAPSGFDAEDGPLGGSTTTSTLIIQTLPAQGVLYYNGQAVVARDTIPGFDATKLTIQLTGSGYQSVSFQYSFVDSDGKQGNWAPMTVNWSQPLPVTLVSFKAEKNGSLVSLSWTTSEERNNLGFDILRSSDATVWEKIGFVKSQAEKSYVTGLFTYTFRDAIPLKSDGYYRLKQIDYDGKYQLGPVRSVSPNENSISLTIYPNPTDDRLVVDGLSGGETIQVVNESGQQVLVTRNDSGKDKVLNIKSWKTGVYVLTLTEKDGRSVSKRVVKTK